MRLKTCYKCQNTFRASTDHFYSNRSRADGLGSECIGCKRDMNRNTISQRSFGGLRLAVIERDNNRCVGCGMSRQKHVEVFGRDITVDHIDGRGRNTLPGLQNNTINNLQTLCLPCHGSKDITRSPRCKKLTAKDASAIRSAITNGATNKSQAIKYSVSDALISYIRHHKVNYR